MPSGQDVTRQLDKQQLIERLNQLPPAPHAESDCIESTRVIEALAKIGVFESEMADRLQAILFFIPRGSYRELFWPAIWLRASRLLRAQGFVEKLKEVACSPESHYLSAGGAIALASQGFFEGDVQDWLKNTRDYGFLTDSEQRELETILLELEGASQELAVLRSKISDS